MRGGRPFDLEEPGALLKVAGVSGLVQRRIFDASEGACLVVALHSLPLLLLLHDDKQHKWQSQQMCVCVTSPYPLRCSRAARGHPAAAGGGGAHRRPNRRGILAAPPGSWWWQAGSPSSRTRPCRRPALTLHLPCAFWHRRKGALKVALDCFLLPGSRDSGRCCTPVYSAVALRARPTRVDAVTAVRLAPHRLRAFLSPVSISSPRQQQHVDSSPRQQQHVDSSPRQQQHVDSSPWPQQLIDTSPRPA